MTATAAKTKSLGVESFEARIGGVVKAAELLDVLGVESPSETRLKTAKRPRRKPSSTGATGPGIRLQGNWKRRKGVATRYEVEVAIERLLTAGVVVVCDGGLRLARGVAKREPTLTREERWAREDDELRAHCQQLSVHETRSPKPTLEPGDIQSVDASVCHEPPRPSVGKYVKRELAHTPVADYRALVETIALDGGLEWVLEEYEAAWMRAKARMDRKAGKR